MWQRIREEIRDRAFRIMRPHFWFQNEPTCDTYSKHLEEQIKSGVEIQERCHYTTRIGGVTLWTENYPYSYGHVLPGGEALPTARVRKMLRDYIAKSQAANPWADTDSPSTPATKSQSRFKET